jgi:glycosyltransferase involved in cell wall biosynthesis
MIVARKLGDDDSVGSASGKGLGAQIRLRFVDAARYAIARRFLGAKTTYYVDYIGLPGTAWMSHLCDAQVISLHWVSGFLTSCRIRKMAQFARIPLVWTLMDLAPLTGGCHYPGDCLGYTQRCGRCPQIHSDTEHDLSRWTWQRKAKNFRDLPITIVAPTGWVADHTARSSLFGNARIVKIPLAIDAETFRPMDQRLAREVLHLPQGKKLIFFGACSMSEERKGFAYLIEALRQLAARLAGDPELPASQVGLMTAGQGFMRNPALPFESHSLGMLSDERVLALAYQAADVFVSPSIEDAGPMMINESLMCGTPVVAFHVGGAPDWVENLRTGYLAAMRDSADLAHGIYTVLTASDRAVAMRLACRETALMEFAPRVVARKYMELYESLIDDGTALAT